jgi:hypothetical protein
MPSLPVWFLRPRLSFEGVRKKIRRTDQQRLWRICNVGLLAFLSSGVLVQVLVILIDPPILCLQDGWLAFELSSPSYFYFSTIFSLPWRIGMPRTQGLGILQGVWELWLVSPFSAAWLTYDPVDGGIGEVPALPSLAAGPPPLRWPPELVFHHQG